MPFWSKMFWIIITISDKAVPAINYINVSESKHLLIRVFTATRSKHFSLQWDVFGSSGKVGEEILQLFPIVSLSSSILALERRRLSAK